jgi:hypothetical protein
MIKIKSLTRSLVVQFAIIIAPVTLVLIYQTAANILRTTTVERTAELRNHAKHAKDAFESFVTLASDSVETGNLSQRAQVALGQSISALSLLGSNEDIRATYAIVHLLSEQIVAGMPLDKLLALQPQITKARDAIHAMDAGYEKANATAVAALIAQAQVQSTIVAIAAVITLLLAGRFLYEMITGITEPLNAAIGLAESFGVPISDECQTT